MISVHGLTLLELSLLTSRDDDAEKAVRFGDSIMMRELIHALTFHSCERGCQPLELTYAEMISMKRQRNPNALQLFQRRFSYNISATTTDEMLAFMRANDLTLVQYLEAWMKEFTALGVQVLHGELEAEELFGDGYAYELWQRFSKELS